MTEHESVWDRGPDYRNVASESAADEGDEGGGPPEPDDVPGVAPEAPAGVQRGVLAGAAVVLVVVAVAASVLLVTWSDDDTGAVSGVVTTDAVPAIPTEPVVPATSTPTEPVVPATSSAVTTPAVTEPTAPASAAPPTAIPTSEPTSTSEPIPTSEPTSTSGPIPTSEPTSTSGPIPTTEPNVPTGGPVVTATGREGPCRFGSNCLIAGFSISGFDVHPGEFVCEFGDGSRYTFRFETESVADACATSAADGMIVVEVGDVRADPVTRP